VELDVNVTTTPTEGVTGAFEKLAVGAAGDATTTYLVVLLDTPPALTVRVTAWGPDVWKTC
jgi:hypothetical protein